MNDDDEARLGFLLQQMNASLDRKAMMPPWKRNLEAAVSEVGKQEVGMLLTRYTALASADALRQHGFQAGPTNLPALRQELKEEMEESLGEQLTEFFTGSIDSTISSTLDKSDIGPGM